MNNKRRTLQECLGDLDGLPDHVSQVVVQLFRKTNFRPTIRSTDAGGAEMKWDSPTHGSWDTDSASYTVTVNPNLVCDVSVVESGVTSFMCATTPDNLACVVSLCLDRCK